jgi:AcrR family transcriptional regulator
MRGYGTGMGIPPPWSTLTTTEKRTRALAVADRLFARDGVDVPMPVLARELGVGVGSIYRQVGAKDEIVAALVIARADLLRDRFTAALDADDPWDALARATFDTVDDCVQDALSQSAWDAAAQTSVGVREARAGATAALAALVQRARAAGLLHPDAGHEDLRLLFCSLRDLGAIGPDAAHRLAELVLRGIRA